MGLELSETDFREKIQSTFDRIDRALADIDPDVLESSLQFGALTLTMGNGARTILSAQPSVRQLWLALASKGMAIHFNWDNARAAWLDDKGQGIELIDYLTRFLAESAGVKITL